MNPIERKTGFALIEKVGLKTAQQVGYVMVGILNPDGRQRHPIISGQWDHFLRSEEGLRAKAGN